MATPAADELREQVRERYARAARAAAGGHLALPVELEGTAASEAAATGTGATACCGNAATDTAATGTGATACCGDAATDTAAPRTGATSCCGDAVTDTAAPGTGATSCCDAAASDDAVATAAVGLYDDAERSGLPDAALLASLGCGNPLAVAELRPGETVLDLGSGGGIDVLLSARRVGPEGYAYGLDMTAEMLELARRNAAEAGVGNVSFLEGQIEAVPLADDSVDVVISNCVINLSVDKPATFREMFRVVRPGGRVGITDIVAEDTLAPAERAARGSYAGCIAGALSFGEYREGLAAAGFQGIEVEPTHAVVDGIHSAIVRATKPEVARR